MLAYIFWHVPVAGTEASAYEAALAVFQAELAKSPPPGFASCTSFRIGGVPWLGGRAGYEDWCFVGGSADLDPLNEAAVDARRRGRHDAVASRTDIGHGGLYRHFHGEAQPHAGTRIIWLRRPRGIEFAPVLRRMIDGATGFLSCWRRQMALGPAEEFCVIGSEQLELSLAPGWFALPVGRTPLAPAK
jgi:hypothetical protein